MIPSSVRRSITEMISALMIARMAAPTTTPTIESNSALTCLTVPLMTSRYSEPLLTYTGTGESSTNSSTSALIAAVSAPSRYANW